MIDGMLVVDMHNHVGIKGSNMGGQTAAQLIARMDRNGIDIAVICPFNAGMLAHEEFVDRNSYTIGAMDEHPDRLIGFCTVTPYHGQLALDEVRRRVDQGMRGIKLHPRKHGSYSLNSEMLDPLMELARDLGISVLTHTDVNTKECTPYLARMLALRHPEVPLIAAHMGMDADTIHDVPDIVKDASNLLLECSATPDMPHVVFNNTCRKIGADRVVYGSDTPGLSPEVNLMKLQVAEELFGLSKEAKRKILGENAARILNLKV